MNIFIRLILVAALIASVIGWGTNQGTGYPFWVILLIFAIFSFILPPRNWGRGPGGIALVVILLIKYAIVPLSYSFTVSYNSFARNYDYILPAFFMVIFEELCVLVALFYVASKTKSAELRSVKSSGKYGKIFFYVSTAVLVGLLCVAPRLISGIELLAGKENIVSSPDRGVVDTIISIAWQCLTTWFFVNLLIRLSKRGGEKCILEALIVVVGFTLVTFLGQSRISRWYTIVSFAAILAFLYKAFGAVPKKALILACIPVLCGFIAVTLYKNTNYLGGAGIGESVLSLFDAGRLDAYAGGIVGVNNAIGLKEETAVDIRVFSKDALYSMPIASHSVKPGESSGDKYNMYIGRWFEDGGDQIIPLIGQSAIYFGYILAPTLSVLMVVLVGVFDRKYFEARDDSAYVWAFWSIWSACSLVLNLTIFLSNVYIRIIPMLVCFYILRELSRREDVRRV